MGEREKQQSLNMSDCN